MSLQEKFQIITPYSKKHDDDGDKWQSFENARSTNGTLKGEDKFNRMPVGMELNQCNARIESMPLVMSGANDVSKDTNAESFEHGFSRYKLDGAEESYTGEQVDLFYGEAVDEKGLAGFAERNNYLDRI